MANTIVVPVKEVLHVPLFYVCHCNCITRVTGGVVFQHLIPDKLGHFKSPAMLNLRCQPCKCQVLALARNVPFFCLWRGVVVANSLLRRHDILISKGIKTGSAANPRDQNAALQNHNLSTSANTKSNYTELQNQLFHHSMQKKYFDRSTDKKLQEFRSVNLNPTHALKFASLHH